MINRSALAMLVMGGCIGLWAAPYVRGDQQTTFAFSERPEALKFGNSMACKGIAQGYVFETRFDKKLQAASGPGEDEMAVKVSATGVTVLTRASLSIGTTEGSPMPILQADDNVILAVDVTRGITPPVDIMLIDKRTGNAIWSTTRSGTGFLPGLAGHSEYLECR